LFTTLKRGASTFRTRLIGMTEGAAQKLIQLQVFALEKVQGLKPISYFQHVAARLKSCPDTNHLSKRVFGKL
jgi:hypothetical protein